MTTNGLKGYQNVIKSTGNSAVYNPSTSIVTTPLTDKYTIGDDIGRGKFAVVRKCTNTETGEVLAAKFIKKRRRGKSCREEILREVVMLEMALDHPRLVNLKEVYETQQELILITEYCAGGELFTECILEEKFVESDVRGLMAQILEGLVYLHERKIVHLDLKPQNILLTEEFPKGSVKICDLGFACLVNAEEDIRDIIGTPDYVAPEVLNYDSLGLYTDMWSLGVLTYVMLTTCSPFAGDDKQETFCNITTVNLEFPDDLFANISDDAVDFIQKLLVAEPSERMTAKDCMQHEWLADLFRNTSESLLTPGLQELGFESKLSSALTEHSNNMGRDKVENQTSEMSVSEVKDEGADDDDEACSHAHRSNTSNITQLRHDDIVTPDSGIDDTFENKLNEIDSNVISETRSSQEHIESVEHEAVAVMSENADSVEAVTDVDPEDSHWENTDTDVKGSVDSDTNETEDEEMLSSSGFTGTEEVPEAISKPFASDNSAYRSHSGEGGADSSVAKVPETVDLVTDIHSSCESSDDPYSVMEHSGISESVDETEHVTSMKTTQSDNVSRVYINSVEQRVSVGEKLGTLTPVSNNSTTDHLFTITGRRSFCGFTGGESGDQQQQQGTKGRHSVGISDPSSHSSNNLEKHKLSLPDERPGYTTPDKSDQTDEVEYEFVPVSKRVRSYEDSLSPTSPKIPRSPMINRHNRHKPH